MDRIIPREKLGSIKRQDKIYSIVATGFFCILCGLVIFPVIIFFIASFRPGADLLRLGLSLTIDPERMTINNYRLILDPNYWETANLGKNYFFQYWNWYKNSLILTILQVSLNLFLAYCVAYGLSQYRYKIRDTVFFLVIATMMVPFEILMIPLFREVTVMGLMNSLAGVILPGIVGAGTIFFFRQFMLGLPHDLLEAGRIDGANEYRICFQIMFPLTKPAFAAQGILAAMGSWNNVLWPLLVFTQDDKFTLPIGLSTLMTPYGNNYDLLMSGSFFSLIPILTLFLIFQRYFIGGMTVGAVKG
jgi:arabinosaccharide transport system permease protein